MLTDLTNVGSICQRVGCNKFVGKLRWKKKIKYCSLDCEYIQERRNGNLVEKKVVYPLGYYVYGWYNPGENLPFYVGEGTGNRAWKVHKKTHQKITCTTAEKAFCEYFRSKDTKVVIYRDNLTREGSLLCESLLSSVFKNMGAVLLHQREPMKRQEQFPLEISNPY